MDEPPDEDDMERMYEEEMEVMREMHAMEEAQQLAGTETHPIRILYAGVSLKHHFIRQIQLNCTRTPLRLPSNHRRRRHPHLYSAFRQVRRRRTRPVSSLRQAPRKTDAVSS